MAASKPTPQKKRHHYVPESYLKSFCNDQGKLLVYRKDDPHKALPLVPSATQVRRYYYSQPTPEGGQDNNTLEDLFSTIESAWPETVVALERRENVNDRLENVFEFMSLQRVRVPAARDAAEVADAQAVKMTLSMLYASGKLPEFPGGKEILEAVEVSIDPHRSIHAMVQMMQGMAPLYNAIGLRVLHNQTPIPFLTNDNPVMWFDPSLPFSDQRPYTVDIEQGEILLIFPVSPKLMIVGSKDYQNGYSRNGLQHAELTDHDWVDAINAQICRFAYEAVISSTPGQEKLVAAFAEQSPVVETEIVTVEGRAVSLFRQTFGKRVLKPKWETSSD